MSRIDPGLLQPAQPMQGLRPFPTALQRAQQDVAITDQQAQVQDRQAQADALKIANQKARATYNASMAVRGWLQNNPDAFKNDPQAAMGQLLSVGGPDAVPVIKDLLDQNTSAIANAKAKLQWQSDLHGKLITAYSQADPSEHVNVEREILQQEVQAGTLTQEQANAMLAKPPDTVDELAASKAKIDRQNELLGKSADLNLKAQQAFEVRSKGQESAANVGKATAEAEKATAEAKRVGHVPGVDVPFTPEVQAQKIAEKSVPQPPMSAERFAQQLALEKEKAATANAIPPLDFIKETSSTGLPYIDSGKVEPKTLNALQTAAGQANIPVVDKDTAAGLRDAATVKLQQQRMLDLLDGRLADTPLSRLLVAPENKAKQLGQLDPNLAVTGTFVGPAIQALRAMAGGKNFRITQAEINNAIDNFVPKATDTVAVARKKVETITGFINDKERVALGNKGTTGAISVTDPNGKVHSFDTQAQADEFKRRAGIK